jgi:Family of unknown function (DUF6594)
LQIYEILSQNSLSSIPPGSTSFGCPEELIATAIGSEPPTLLDCIFRRPKSAKLQYRVRKWSEFSNLENLPGGDYFLKDSLQFRELDKDGREARAEENAFSERLRMALFGGLGLLAPVIVMTLVPGRTSYLVTTSVAILLFALALAIFAEKTSGKDILAATAAYAAVLVVFIGTSATSV